MDLQIIQQKKLGIRGHEVMLDSDLAAMYEVETKVFNQAIKRNMERFPEEFMFQWTEQEWKSTWSQFVTRFQKSRRKDRI